jgi:hypothetical protein
LGEIRHGSGCAGKSGSDTSKKQPKKPQKEHQKNLAILPEIMLIKWQLNIINIAFVSEQTGRNSGTQSRGTKPLKGMSAWPPKGGFKPWRHFLFSEVAKWGYNYIVPGNMRAQST